MEDEEEEIQEMHENDDDMQNDDEDEQTLSSSDGASDDEQKVQYECEGIENIFFMYHYFQTRPTRNLTFFVLKFLGHKL